MKDIFEKLEKKKVYLTLLAIIILAFSFYQYNIIKDFKQVPACLYGCDLYNHMGDVYHLYFGGSFFRDGANPDVNSWTPSLYQLMVADFAKISGMNPLFAYDFFTIISGVMSITIVFFLFRMLFNKSLYGFFGVLLFLPLFPVWKYTNFTAIVMMPLFFLCFLYFLKKKTILSSVYMGISFGIVSLTSSNAFFAVVFMVATSFFFIIIPELSKLKNMKKKEFKSQALNIFKNIILPFCIITLIGMSIAMLYWYEPIFRFHLHMTNLQSNFDSPDLSDFTNFVNAITGTFSTFISFSDIFTFILMALSILGILFMFLLKKRDSLLLIRNYLVICFFAIVFGSLNFIVLFPLFKLNLLCGWILYMLNTTAKIMFILFSIFILNNIFSKKNSSRSNIFYIVVTAIIIIISFAGIGASLNSVNNDKYAVNAKTDIDSVHKQVQDWVIKNTNVNDIFLTTNENSFMLNALTGRKMMTFRRSHSNQFLDFDQIMLDAGLILYGNNSDLTKELLVKYNVKYFYWDYYWLNTEFEFDNNGNIVGFFDPFVTSDTPDNRKILDDNNVKYVAKHWYLDPGVEYEGIPQYDLLFIYPASFNASKPWSNTFDNFIVPLDDMSYQGTSYAKIYDINLK